MFSVEPLCYHQFILQYMQHKDFNNSNRLIHEYRACKVKLPLSVSNSCKTVTVMNIKLSVVVFFTVN